MMYAVNDYSYKKTHFYTSLQVHTHTLYPHSHAAELN